MEDARDRAYAAAQVSIEQAARHLKEVLPPLGYVLADAVWGEHYPADAAPLLAEAEDVLGHWVEVIGSSSPGPAPALVSVRDAATMVRALRELDEQLDAEGL